MCIFKMALVIKNYIQFAFLFVQTVFWGVKMLNFPDYILWAAMQETLSLCFPTGYGSGTETS